jgi:hypothetical protein
VVFRTGDRTYALNDAAMAKGFASVKPLQVVVEPPPRNPLARVKQETRMQIFARAAACGETGSERAVAAGACRQRLRDAHGLSDDELKQIEAEGTERRWRPLSPEYRSLAPLVEAGLKLCPAAQRRASLTYPQLLESQIHAGALTVDPALEMRNRSLNSTLPL